MTQATLTKSIETVEQFKAKQEAELQAFIAEQTKLAIQAKKAEEQAKIDALGIKFEEVEQTYNGDTGCACGCGGDYTKANDNVTLTKKRLTIINKAIIEGRAEFFGNGVEVANESYTRVTRIYFVDGVSK
jgi:hypothetical protein